MALKNQMARSAALGVAMLIGVGLCAPQAQAAYVVTVEQVGSGVVATGAGSIDFSALIFYGAGGDSAGLSASDGVVAVGPTIDTPDTYYAGIAGPVATFGTGGPFDASSGAGAIVGLGNFGQMGGGVVAVPQGYAPGTPLGTSTDAWAGATLGSLGLTPGTYVWRWGSGASADSFTLDIRAGEAPEPATWAMMLLGLAGLALVRSRRRLPTSG